MFRRKNNEQSPQIYDKKVSPTEVKNQKTLSKYTQKLIEIERVREEN